MIRPPRLPEGGTVAIVSPSWGGPAHLPDRYNRARAALESLGYQVKSMPHSEQGTYGKRDWLSASPADRISDIHQAFSDPTIHMVLTSIGGNHSAQLVDALDYELITANPKPFCGYSDNTVLLHAIHQRTNMVTFYGPALLPEFGEVGGPDTEVVTHWQRTLGIAEPPGALPRTDWQSVEFRGDSDAQGRSRARVAGEPRLVLRSGSAQGPLLPACLPSMRNLIGTGFEVETAGRILVLEPPEAPYDPELADADLAHLRLTGGLDSLAGLVVGRSDGWSVSQLAQFHESVLDAVRHTTYPVIAGVECTHSAPMMTLPIGVNGEISGDDLIVTEAAVS